ncbi:MAG: hypothetical protein DRJ65_13975 [Acidobacteria bacterium]|nr:MAG: hypothetical protein DRJ65_13975 [Acidobacteriota bacterium]
MKQIFVIAEIFANQIRPVTWELVAAARVIEKNLPSQQSSPAIHVIVPADHPLPLAETIAQRTGMDVIGLQIPELKTEPFAKTIEEPQKGTKKHKEKGRKARWDCMWERGAPAPHGDSGSLARGSAYSGEIYISCIEQLAEELNPSHILIAHTPQGQDFAPGLAVGINAASVPAVNGIRTDEEGLIYSRPVFDNSRNLLVRPTQHRPVVLTVMPGIFKAAVGEEQKSGRVEIRDIPNQSAAYGDQRIRHRRTLKRSCENQALKEVKVIVAAGRGIKEKENLKEIFEFAQSFSSAAVGASRPLIDMKWSEDQHHVGITGATVSPRLYIACGISGSTQHLAGIKKAEFVVAINKNPEAPIFLHADLCIIEDVLEFIDVFLTKRGENNGFCDFK